MPSDLPLPRRRGQKHLGGGCGIISPCPAAASALRKLSPARMLWWRRLRGRSLCPRPRGGGTQGRRGQGGDSTFVTIDCHSPEGGPSGQGRCTPHTPSLNSSRERKSTHKAAPLPPPTDAAGDQTRVRAVLICIHLHTQLRTAASGFGP